MADMNEFLKKLGIAPQDASMLSPMASSEDARPEQDEFAASDEDNLPALEEGEVDNFTDVQPMKKGTPLMSQSDISKIQSIPLPASQKAMPAPARAPAEMSAEAEINPQIVKANQMESLLSQYQKSRDGNQLNLNLLRGANQIAQGFAMGSGAKIGDGSEAVNALEKQLDQPIKDYSARIDNEMDEPNSDVSKFMRQQAYAVLKKLSPETNYEGKLENMSANQLQKLPGMKNILAGSGGGGLEWVGTDRVTRDGSPVKFNKATGVYANGITGEPIQPGETVVRDIARKDELTGQYGYVSRNNGMQVMPTNYGGATINQESKVGSDGKKQAPQDVDFGDFTRKAPKVAEDFRSLQKEFNADMKESREVATSVTNLANKLAGGETDGVDSGLLGGIQTQAAKMAGQKGVLTDQDLVKFAGAGGWKNASARALKNAALGKMSDADIKFFNTFAQKMGKSLEMDIADRTKLYAGQGRGMVSSVVPDITEENVAKWLGSDRVAPAVQDPTRKSTSKDSNVVKVKGPSGQIAPMTKENAEKYLKKPGYSLVQ